MIKKTRLPLLAAATVIAVLTTGAFAKGSIELRDVDGDGVISAEEIRSLAEQQRNTQRAQYDSDGDGELSTAERDAMRQAHRAEKVAAADTNSDGKLSRDERRAARDARRNAIEAQLDLDGDGKVSDLEGAGFDEYRKEMRKEHRHERGGKKDRDAG